MLCQNLGNNANLGIYGRGLRYYRIFGTPPNLLSTGRIIMVPMTEEKKGCGCGGKKAATAGQHSGCGCGGKGRHHGIRTENTPASAPDDVSQGRKQLGLRGI
ncbi:hypothetical protein SAMN04489737_1637 [Arcanobacterium phocae]|uniref:Uncharacterized protein n=2 Tax=Arcanobacterium phocae TaxID=131112 RepID=A0A1H2LMV9_9ACTO|nr:hypothetical protein SAMN04489737_1637 [Arcanobacterium phocae]